MKRFWEFIATGFYSGKLPFMPGTWGSILATVLVFITYRLGYIFQVSLIFATFALGVIASEEVSRELKDSDPDCVVIDEFLGIELTFFLLKPTLLQALIGLLIFRAIDIFKPYPIKKFEKLPGGLGIMADDAVAGVFSNVLLRLVLILFHIL